LLIQCLSDIHARDDKGRTPCQLASEEEHDGLMQLLLEHGAEDHRTLDREGPTSDEGEREQ
jgi:ankyrin repeat protein